MKRLNMTSPRLTSPVVKRPGSKAPPVMTELQSLARPNAVAAIEALVEIMLPDTAPASARVAAANALLHRGWGKCLPPHADDISKSPEPVHRIERVIVDRDPSQAGMAKQQPSPLSTSKHQRYR